jgi:hypothetical protein
VTVFNSTGGIYTVWLSPKLIIIRKNSIWNCHKFSHTISGRASTESAVNLSLNWLTFCSVLPLPPPPPPCFCSDRQTLVSSVRCHFTCGPPPPSMSSYWSKACAAQLNRPLLQLQQANYAGCIFAASVTQAKFTRVTGVLRSIANCSQL